MKTLLVLALFSSAIRAQTGFEAQVEAGVQAATAQARKTASTKPAKPAPAPREAKDGIIPRFQQKKFPLSSDGTCGLKAFTLLDYEIRDSVKNGEASRMTQMGAVIETTSPDCLREYGVVQFIRGCVYHTRYDIKTGLETEKVFDVARRLRGPRVVFNHPGYEVDRTELDPLYASYPSEAHRLDLLYAPNGPMRLRPDAASMAADRKYLDRPDERTFLKDLATPTAIAFVGDLPDHGQSVINEEGTILSALNASLDFRTCLYRVKDVPTTGDPAGEGVAPENGGPLQCFGWMSRYTFEPATQDFVTDKFSSVDPFCATAPPRAPLPGS
ncbi:MAG: hypothetical protein ABL955_08375 [Elusimicrobiota bacterium]